MGCPGCLVGFAGLGDAQSARLYAPVSPSMPLAGPSDPASSAEKLVALGVGAIVAYYVFRAVLPSAAGGR